MELWQSGYVAVDGLRLHYTRTGAGALRAKPAVVLAHGFSDDGLCWTPLAKVLERDYDVVMIDARGHGQSDGTEASYGVQELAHDLHGVIAALQLQRPAILGHSMGGRTTLALAGLYPDVPGSILIEDGDALGIAAVDPDVYDEQRARSRSELAALQRKTRQELIDDLRAEHPEWPETELEPWADAKLRLRPEQLNLHNRGMDWLAVLRQITCPALLITADPERGGMITPERVAALQALIPQLHIAHITGAGHSIRREQPDRYLHAVRTFLAAWATDIAAQATTD